MLGEAQAFLRPHAEKAVSRQGFPEKADGAVLKSSVEINHHIAAGDQLHFRKDGVRDQAVIGEDDIGAQRLVEDGSPIVRSVVVGAGRSPP